MILELQSYATMLRQCRRPVILNISYSASKNVNSATVEPLKNDSLATSSCNDAYMLWKEGHFRSSKPN